MLEFDGIFAGPFIEPDDSITDHQKQSTQDQIKRQMQH
jgi:hypothetical protein